MTTSFCLSDYFKLKPTITAIFLVIQRLLLVLIQSLMVDNIFPSLHVLKNGRHQRIRIETVLLKSHVLSEVQRSMLDGGMHVGDVPVDSVPRYRTTSHLDQQRAPSEFPERFKESNAGMGGPGGLWHFIYRSIYLDQYVSSEFSSPISSRQQQKRYLWKISKTIQ